MFTFISFFHCCHSFEVHWSSCFFACELLKNSNFYDVNLKTIQAKCVRKPNLGKKCVRMCPSVSENLNSGQKMSENLNSDPENCPKIWIQIPKIFWKTWIQIQILEFQKSEQLNWEILGEIEGKKKKNRTKTRTLRSSVSDTKKHAFCVRTLNFTSLILYIIFCLYFNVRRILWITAW